MRASRWLPILQQILRTLVLLALAVMGVVLIMYAPSKLYDTLVLPMPDTPLARIIGGALLALLGLAALVPLPNRLVSAKSITFSDDMGTDVVHLAPLERTLTKEVSALPEVKRAEVFLSPTSDRRSVDVRAEVVLRKSPQVSSSAIRVRLKNFLLTQARELLGTDEVAHVELEVLDISVEQDLAMEMTETITQNVPETEEPPRETPPAEETVPAQPAVLEPIDLDMTPEETTDQEEPLPGSPLPPFNAEDESENEKEPQS